VQDAEAVLELFARLRDLQLQARVRRRVAIDHAAIDAMPQVARQAPEGAPHQLVHALAQTRLLDLHHTSGVRVPVFETSSL